MSRILTGTVVSDKNDKTIVVSVQSSKTHPVYKKQYKQTKRYQAHDAKNEAHVGDVVTIVETKPMSATKHFALHEIISKAAIEHVEEEMTV